MSYSIVESLMYMTLNKIKPNLLIEQVHRNQSLFQFEMLHLQYCFRGKSYGFLYSSLHTFLEQF